METSLENKSKKISIEFILNKLSDDMHNKYIDKAFYYMLKDAQTNDGDFHLVGKNIFRPEQVNPFIDELNIEEKKLVVGLLFNKI